MTMIIQSRHSCTKSQAGGQQLENPTAHRAHVMHMAPRPAVHSVSVCVISILAQSGQPLTVSFPARVAFTYISSINNTDHINYCQKQTTDNMEQTYFSE